MDQYIGRLLDNRYEILEIIGTGGMAVVYKARCHRLNRLVAIKILKDEFARDEEFRRRFHAEGEAVAMLSHPNIVQVYDVSSSDNANFIVMELIDGITLKQYMEKKGVLNWKETLHFGMQIAKALEHAHSRSIVHRDIKPHNVMVLKNGSVKVTDFGIARVMSKSNTLTKEALGSVHYISPEQAKGGWVDNRSDLYSLGVVMYEMMTGRPPYDGESPVAVAIQHINGGAAMPSTLNPNIPGGLEQIIMRSMALDPKDRYPSATEMLKDMDEFRKDPSVLFVFPSHGLGMETKVLPSSAAVAEAARQPRTTAEKVAGAAAGAAGASAAAAAAARAPRSSAAGTQQQSRPRTGEVPRTTAANGTRTSANTGRNAAQGAARAASQTTGTRSATGNTGRTASGTAAVSGAARTDAARRQAANRAAQNNRKTREEIREEIREEERNRMATIAVIACSAVAVIAIIVFLVALMNGAFLNRSGKTLEVPNLVGAYYDSLEEYEGFQIRIKQQIYNENVEEGKIIEQDPLAGEMVAKDTDIWLTVSMGKEPQVKTMIDMTGLTAEDAQTWADGQKMGLIVLEKQEFHETIEEGLITRTDPAAEAELAEGQTIWIYVSSGPVIETAKMENVIGKKENVAINILSGLGFSEVEPEYEYADEDEGVVIDQSVKAGTEIDVTTKIILTVSKGPKTAKMINVVGQQYDTAYENLTDLGFTVVTRKDVESEEEAGEVVDQSISRGEEISVSKEIVLSVSLGPKPTEPPTEAPTEAPTDPPVEEVTITETFALPTDMTEDYLLGLYQNGQPVIEDTIITAGTTEINVTLTGSGTQSYDLYINDEYYKTVKVDFTPNG